MQEGSEYVTLFHSELLLDNSASFVSSRIKDLCQQEAQLMLTNPRDAFRGQSRSPNIVSFHMLGTLSSCAIVTLTLFDVKRCRDLRIPG